MSNKIIVSDIEVGDIFSEESHYVYKGVEIKDGKTVHVLTHLGSNTDTYLNEKYVTDLLSSADQYEKEVEVGREDKFWTAKQIDEAVTKGTLLANHSIRVGDLRVKGIRTIWSEIYSSKVFTVEYVKQDKAVSAKVLNEAKAKQLAQVLEKLRPTPVLVTPTGPILTSKGTRSHKKRVPVQIAPSPTPITIEEALKLVQENPILDYIPGEVRELRGYKIQFSSINGSYDVIDMELPTTDPAHRIRQVNVNTIRFLVVDGIKYIVK